MHSAEKPPVRRRVQRRTKRDSKGTGDAPPAEPKLVDEVESGWAVSSFELKHGLDVEDVGDTVPAELLDKLFGGPRS